MSGDTIPLTALPGWEDDDHAAALAAFAKSFRELKRAFPDLRSPDGEPAKRYFEETFVAQRVTGVDGSPQGLFTGYFEPVLAGSRRRHGAYQVPLLARPPDLVTLIDDSLRASAGQALTHGRRLADGGVVAYPTRREIEQGRLDHMDLAFVYLADAVDAFFLHVQGSGLIELDDGSRVRVSYAAKNGRPYTSLGAELIRLGEIDTEAMTLEALAGWLRADRERGRRFMWRNESYIFFEEIGPADTARPLGVRGIELSAGRSLAVDASLHPIGIAMFVVIDNLPDMQNGMTPFARLMVAQDVGSAIRGPVRGDIFFGTGLDAGGSAGRTRHKGSIFRLIPRVGGR